MKQAINDYYWKTFWATVDVTLEMSGADPALDPDTYTYTITMDRLIAGSSANGVTSTPRDTEATIVIVPPTRGTPSSPPITGKYIVRCTDPATQQEYNSWEIWYNAGVKDVEGVM
jgi:hypothetical protein